MSTTVQRGWMPYRTAARQYLGISEDVLLGAIKRQELKAYEKPVTRGRTTSDPAGQHKSYFVCTADVDEWIRTHWHPAFTA